jgi:hypothetical protein
MPLLKRVYSVVDKASFLDWGLTSDYKIEDDSHGCGDKRLRVRDTGEIANSAAERHKSGMSTLSSSQYSSELSAFSAARYTSRNTGGKGLGGGTLGSEGYGEATIGSAHKLGLLLTNLRQVVLQELYDTHWGLLFDLGPHSTFLDIGSGYGKVVLHLRLVSRMRRSVGMECVASRDEIAKQALASLESEVGTSNGAGAGSDDGASSTSSGRNSAANSQDASEALSPRFISSGPFDGVEFECADATALESLPYTHIYIFDWVFSKSTLRDMAPVLQRSPFYILCSFRKV